MTTRSFGGTSFGWAVAAVVVLHALAGTASAQDLGPVPDPPGTDPGPAAGGADGAPPPEDAEAVPPPPPPPPPPAVPPPPPNVPLPETPPPAAPPPPPTPTHVHSGFFLRGTLGLGALSVAESGPTSEVILSGGTALVSIGIGGVVTENLAIHADLTGAGSTAPRVEVDGVERPGLSAEVGVSALGVGVTWYFMPLNAYVMGALGFGTAQRTSPDDEIDDITANGFSLDVMVGKEWWVGSEWGIGVAVQVLWMALGDGDRSLSALGGGVNLSVTYN